MSRPLRIEYAGAVYQVASRGSEKEPVFKDDADRLNFLDTLQHAKKRYNWICHACCLMTNHYHILVETPAVERHGYLQREIADHLGQLCDNKQIGGCSGANVKIQDVTLKLPKKR